MGWVQHSAEKSSPVPAVFRLYWAGKYGCHAWTLPHQGMTGPTALLGLSPCVGGPLPAAHSGCSFLLLQRLQHTAHSTQPASLLYLSPSGGTSPSTAAQEGSIQANGPGLLPGGTCWPWETKALKLPLLSLLNMSKTGSSPGSTAVCFLRRL